MATPYPTGSGPVIRGVMVLELNFKLGGMQPMNLYEVAYVDGGGQTMGRVRCNVLTPAAQKKLEALVDQLEVDFIEVSGTELHAPESLETPREDGLTYPSP